jgi:hypothetical protein
MARGNTAAMAAAIDDELLGEFAVSAGSWEEAGRLVRERCEGVLDRVGMYSVDERRSTEEGAAIVRGFR